MMSNAASYAILIYDGVEPIDIGATFGVLSMASRKIQSLSFLAWHPPRPW